MSAPESYNQMTHAFCDTSIYKKDVAGMHPASQPTTLPNN